MQLSSKIRLQLVCSKHGKPHARSLHGHFRGMPIRERRFRRAKRPMALFWKLVGGDLSVGAAFLWRALAGVGGFSVAQTLTLKENNTKHRHEDNAKFNLQGASLPCHDSTFNLYSSLFTFLLLQFCLLPRISWTVFLSIVLSTLQLFQNVFLRPPISYYGALQRQTPASLGIGREEVILSYSVTTMLLAAFCNLISRLVWFNLSAWCL